ncbi:MAG: hypothetical protein V1770_00090 [bacterium]
MLNLVASLLMLFKTSSNILGEKMRKINVFLLVLILTFFKALPLKAEKTMEASSFRILTGFLQENGILINENPIYEFKIGIPLPKNFGIKVRYTKAFADDIAEEMRYSFGWVNDNENFNLMFGIQYINIKKFFNINQVNIINPMAKLIKKYSINKNNGFYAYIWLEFPSSLKKELENGLYIHIGGEHLWKAKEKLLIKNEISVVHDDGALSQRPRQLGKHTLSIAWRFHKNLGLNFTTNAAATIQNSKEKAEQEAVAGIGLIYYIEI